MFAMGRRGGMNVEHTQHRPEIESRTGAPWHTRTCLPPGTPTSSYWKVVLVGNPAPHDDENGDDVPCPSAMCRVLEVEGASDVSVLAGGETTSHGVCVASEVTSECVSALASVLHPSALHAVLPAASRSSIPHSPAATFIPPIPEFISIPVRLPRCTPGCPPVPPARSANVSSPNLAGSRKSETHAGSLLVVLRP